MTVHARRPVGLIATIVAALLAALIAVAVPGAPAVQAVDTSPTGRYIVLLDEPPLARYDGGIAGLAPTTPSVTGADQLDVDAPASRAYLAHLEARQAAVRVAIGAAIGRPVEAVFSYTAAVNGFAAEMSAAEAAAAQAVAGVRAVVADQLRELHTDNGPAWIGADAIWGGSGGTATMGEGIVVGVIDTGVNHDHPSFAEVGGDGYVHTNPRGSFTGACDPVTGAPFCNDKLVGVWDFTGTTPMDDNGHGSHTASTSAGNVLDAGLVTPTRTFDRPISGVAPHANLITYKVCSGTTAAAAECTLSAILAGIHTAILDEVDVINFSIGGASDDPWFWPDSTGFLDVRAAGIFAAVSAGNDGPGAATIGSPADAPWVLTVGAATHDRALFNSVVDLAGGSTTPPGDLIGKSLTAELATSAPIVHGAAFGFPLCGDGEALATGEALINPFSPGQLDGLIVVCDRGIYGRVEKSQNVAEAGAVGFILTNDALNGDSLIGDAYHVPGVHISYADGNVLLDWLGCARNTETDATECPAYVEGEVTTTGRISGTVVDVSASNADATASFSSRGPNPATGDVLKPDITGPGVDILAAFNTPFTNPLGGGEYGVISGTSMSSPHAAGSGALLSAARPEWSPAEVQSALMTTAFTTPPGDGGETQPVTKEDGTTTADPFDMGSGRLNLHAAASAGLVLDETFENYQKADPATGGDPSTLNTASLAEDACAGSCSWHRLVTGSASGSVSWTASTTAGDGVAVSVEPSSFTVAPGETVRVTVTADATEATPDTWHFGSVVLTPNVGGVPAAHLPVAVFPTVAGAEFDAPVLEDPGDEVNTTGAYTLEWSDVADEVGYVVEESTDYAIAFEDDAEAGMAGRWTTSSVPLEGWTESDLQANSGSQSYWSGNTDEKTVTLTSAQPISVPSGAEAVLTFASYEDTEPDFDYGYVEASADGGETWEEFAKVNGFSDGWTQRSVALRGLDGDVLVRFRYVTDQLISAPLYTGWFVDDVSVSVGTWSATGETDANVTSLAVTDQSSGTYAHRVAGRFDTGGASLLVGPWSNIVDITVERAQADLQVTDMTASDASPHAAQTVTVSTTVANAGEGEAVASTLRVSHADGTVVGTAPIPAIAPGGSAVVDVALDTRGLKGEQVLTATADADDAVDESDESNNSGVLRITVRGNRVRNASFEQPASSADAPDGWTGSSTAAGTTAYEDGGSDGERSVSIGGTGGSVAASGLPTWTSAPIEVTPGETLELVASVRSSGTSSAPSIGLALLGPGGALLDTLTVTTLPRLTDGFAVIEKAVTVPAGVAQVRLVLAGFSPTDLRTAGTVTFDDVGVFAR